MVLPLFSVIFSSAPPKEAAAFSSHSTASLSAAKGRSVKVASTVSRACSRTEVSWGGASSVRFPMLRPIVMAAARQSSTMPSTAVAAPLFFAFFGG